MFNLLFNSKGQQAYDKAKAKMRDLHKRFNSNIPDYNPFELPTDKIFVKYPNEALTEGRIYQRKLLSKRDLRIYELNYTGNAQLKKHTHYGFHEFIYIKHGTFINENDIPYIKGDVIMIDGYKAHALKCLTDNGCLLLSFSSTKSKLNVKHFNKYI